jgi:hypothetical protein
MSLHDKILNIPCEVDKAKKAINRIEYKNGHFDARHKAAELAITYDELLEITIAMRDYIDAIPDYLADQFPAMPGFDRDWADGVIERCKNEKYPL